VEPKGGRHPEGRGSLITFERVTKRYPGGTVALDDVSMDCAADGITVFVGTSGGGKTTALRAINRMVDPTEGRVLIDGADVRDSDPAALRRGIGYVIQHAGLFPHRTVADNIATVPRLLGRTRRAARMQAVELMERVGLHPTLARRYPFQLSGGQQQRVGVARALAADPPLLLMDEPFSAVDPVVRAELQSELLRLQAELHKTIVFVTHDIDEAIKVGDRIGVFRAGGRLVQFDTPENLLTNPADDFVAGFVGYDRGIRRLSFVPASRMRLRTGPVLPAAAGVEDARATGEPWVLVVDERRHPLGWARVDTLEDHTPLGRSPLARYGHTVLVAPESEDGDSVRAALDAVILSPAEMAAAVDGDGAVLGVAGHAEIAEAVAGAEQGTALGGPDR
jgi:osmoprotectant transport system ATP-binding protein